MTNSKTQQESMLIPSKDLLVGNTILFIPSNKTLLFKVLPHKSLSFDVVSWIFLYQPHGSGTPPSQLRALRLASTRGQNVHPTCHRHGNPGSRGCPVRSFVGNLTVPPPKPPPPGNKSLRIDYYPPLFLNQALFQGWHQGGYPEIFMMCGFLWQMFFRLFLLKAARGGRGPPFFVGRTYFLACCRGVEKRPVIFR